MILRTGRPCAQYVSKPRASGDDPPYFIKWDIEPCVNPARAGMIPFTGDLLPALAGKPRASGDDPSEDFGARVRKT